MEGKLPENCNGHKRSVELSGFYAFSLFDRIILAEKNCFVKVKIAVKGKIIKFFVGEE